jgi:hypothetical protein
VQFQYPAAAIRVTTYYVRGFPRDGTRRVPLDTGFARMKNRLPLGKVGQGRSVDWHTYYAASPGGKQTLSVHALMRQRYDMPEMLRQCLPGLAMRGDLN